ncbi:MAG: hypothetical protein HY207_13220 [Nitrospirae bacterium]|nr:hypothetical protein [Nitrospirota bacterium]
MTTRTKRVLIGAAIALSLALAGGLWWLSHSLDSLVASAIRTFGPEITGVAIHLDRVKIDALDGRAELHGLVVGNPKGFSTDHALSLGEIGMTLDLSSLTKDVIVIKQISILKPDVTYELSTEGSNLGVIQRNVDRYVGRHRTATTPQAEREQGKKLVIETLTIKNATATVSAAVIHGPPISVPLPDLHLRDIGKQSGGITAGEAVNQVLAALTQSVTRTIASRNLGGMIDSLRKDPRSAVDKLKGLFR